MIANKNQKKNYKKVPYCVYEYYDFQGVIVELISRAGNHPRFPARSFKTATKTGYALYVIQNIWDFKVSLTTTLATSRQVNFQYILRLVYFLDPKRELVVFY